MIHLKMTGEEFARHPAKNYVLGVGKGPSGVNRYSFDARTFDAVMNPPKQVESPRLRYRGGGLAFESDEAHAKAIGALKIAAGPSCYGIGGPGPELGYFVPPSWSGGGAVMEIAGFPVRIIDDVACAAELASESMAHSAALADMFRRSSGGCAGFPMTKETLSAHTAREMRESGRAYFKAPDPKPVESTARAHPACLGLMVENRGERYRGLGFCAE